MKHFFKITLWSCGEIDDVKFVTSKSDDLRSVLFTWARRNYPEDSFEISSKEGRIEVKFDMFSSSFIDYAVIREVTPQDLD